MRAGRVQLQGTIPELRRRWHAGERLVVTVRPGGDPSFLTEHPAVEAIERAADGEVHLRLRPDGPLGDLLRAIGERLDVTSIRSQEVTLHEIYVRTVGASATASDGAEVGA